MENNLFIIGILLVIGATAITIITIVLANIFKKRPSTTNTTFSMVTPANPAMPKTPKTITTNKKKWGFWSYFWALAGIVILTFLAIVLFTAGSALIHWVKTLSEPNYVTAPKTEPYVPTATTYLFADWPNGKITLYLNLAHGTHWEVLGEKGQRIIVYPTNGEPFYDGPEMQQTGPVMRDGYFTFEVDPKHPGALGVKITI